MSYPILYHPDERDFTHNGIGMLTDAVSCLVTEERNGQYELQMQYPRSGKHFGALVRNAVIKCKLDKTRGLQPFRIYRIFKTLPGMVTVYARHISYDLGKVPVAPYIAENAAAAMQALKANAATDCPFTFETDVSKVGTFTNFVPASARACLGGIKNNILDIYSGELEFDNFAVRLHTERGRDRGVTIRYGKNLTDLQQDENCADVYAGVYPYWSRTETKNGQSTTTYVELPERVIMRSGATGGGVLPLDLSGEFDEQPNHAQLREAAEAYIEEYQIFVPRVSLTVAFALLGQTEEYKALRELETVGLCDTVTVIFPDMAVSAHAKVVKTVYNVLLDRYSSTTLGTVVATVADLIAQQNSSIRSMEQGGAIKHGNLNATDINLYGSFVCRSGDNIGGRLGYMSGLNGLGQVTDGIGMRNADGSCYVAATEAGVAMRGGDAGMYASGDTVAFYGPKMMIGDKTLDWKSNGDGTFTLIGKE